MPSGVPRLAILELYSDASARLHSEQERLIRDSAPLTADSVPELEAALCELDVEHSLSFCQKLRQLAPPVAKRYRFIHQWGATCMSTSLANGLIALGEPAFLAIESELVETVHAFTSHVVDNTSSFGKPFEYRSVDDMQKYLRRSEHRRFGLLGDYELFLSNSILDALLALFTGSGVVVLQQAAHAQLAFELVFDEDPHAVSVRQRDPFTPGPGDDHNVIQLAEWRREFFWSPLKKIPTTMGRGFDCLSAEETLDHLARYEGMDNLGLECSSAILVRVDVPSH